MWARKLPKAELDAIIKEARVFVKSTRACDSTDVETVDERVCIVDDSDSDEERTVNERACLVDDSDSDVERTVDERACLVDGSDSDEECKLSFLFPSST